MKIIFASVAFLLALQASALAGLDTDIPRTHRVILATGGWTPSEEQTQKALIAVQSYLERPAPGGDQRSKGEIKEILANSKRYRVQFVGLVRERRRFIWCNFFPAREGLAKDEFEDWKHAEVRVPDGGFWYWKIEYDLATGGCLHFWVNEFS